MTIEQGVRSKGSQPYFLKQKTLYSLPPILANHRPVIFCKVEREEEPREVRREVRKLDINKVFETIAESNNSQVEMLQKKFVHELNWPRNIPETPIFHIFFLIFINKIIVYKENLKKGERLD